MDSFKDTMRQTSAADVARAQNTLDSLGIGSPRNRRQTMDELMMRGSRGRHWRGGMAPSMRRVQSSVDVRRHGGGSRGVDSSGLHAGQQGLVKSGTQNSLKEDEPAKDWDLLQAFSSSCHGAMAQPSRPLFPSLKAPALTDVRVLQSRIIVACITKSCHLQLAGSCCCGTFSSAAFTGQAWRV